jgi:hypothetical protein
MHRPGEGPKSLGPVQEVRPDPTTCEATTGIAIAGPCLDQWVDQRAHGRDGPRRERTLTVQHR